MAYEVTASKKRPAVFKELAGQDFVVSTLMNSLENQRIAHAYLFSGPRGVGKTSAARILSKALNCEQGPTAEPCGVCSNCYEIASGNALDVIEIDGASNTSVNDVREIKNEVLFAPNSSRYKIYIIDEVHMLSNSAFNALLKTIEEPPPYVVFIFATTEIHKVPATIRSRCQQFHFQLIALEIIQKKLAEAIQEEGYTVEEDALFWIAKEATGSLRDAYTLLDQIISFSEGEITMDKIREKLGLIGVDRINKLVEHLADHSISDALNLSSEILSQGVSVEQFTVDLTEYFRSILFIKQGITAEALIGNRIDHFSERAVQSFSSEHIETIIDLLLNLYRNLRYSLNQRFELELLIHRLGSLSSMVSPTTLIARIEQLQESLELSEQGEERTSSKSESKDKRRAEFHSSEKASSKISSASSFSSSSATSSSFSSAASEKTESSNKTGSASIMQAFQKHLRDAGNKEAAQTGEKFEIPTETGKPDKQTDPSAAVPTSVQEEELEADAADAAIETQKNEQNTEQQAENKPAVSIGKTEDDEFIKNFTKSSNPDHDEEKNTEQTGQLGQFTQETLGEIITSLAKDRPTLASALNQVKRWDLKENTLTLIFSTPFSAEKGRQEKQTIQSLLNERIGGNLNLRFTAENQEREDPKEKIKDDNTVQMITQLFRGEVIDGGKKHGYNGSNGTAEELE